MKILGLHYGHNATVCVLEEGRVTFCQSEERFTRMKNCWGFPAATLEHVYRDILPPEKIDRAVLFLKSTEGFRILRGAGFKLFRSGHHLGPDSVRLTRRQRFYQTPLGRLYRTRKEARKENDPDVYREREEFFRGALQLPPEKITHLDHHLAHAWSAVPNVQAWGRALIFTLDGQGDGKCATVNLYENGRLTVLSATPARHSLGYYYEHTTGLLGMKASEHEFKVMGLAPYAKREHYQTLLASLGALLHVDDQGQWRSRVDATSAWLILELEKLYRFQRFDNIAGAIQEFTELLMTRWVGFWVKKTGCPNVALAGGVVMNVKACQKIAELDCVENIFVVPSAGDESTAIGCAVWGHVQDSRTLPLQPLGHLYLGVEYADAEIEQALEACHARERYQITRPANINRTVAELLAQNVVVARCSGRMEFGARALGNRSILAHPASLKNVQLINDAIKSRDFWMPFTPSILEEDMSRYVTRHEKIFAPYMSITFESIADARRDLAAAIHPKDFTVRPQCVRRDWNPDYHEILSAFKEITGIGGVLNTSFNLHGEPNVCSPGDALRTMDESGLTHLAMGGFLVVKR